MAAPPVFETSAAATARKCSAIYEQRGEEYDDTWALENQSTRYLDMLLDEFNVTLSPQQKRLIKLACLIDVKDDRMLGGYKEDTIIDRINYSLVFADLMEQFRHNPDTALAKLFKASLLEADKND